LDEPKKKLDFSKIKIFCESKVTTNKVKRKLIEWKKTFANHISVKSQYSKTYKKSKKGRGDSTARKQNPI
jgi:hypothetical protein